MSYSGMGAYSPDKLKVKIATEKPAMAAGHPDLPRMSNDELVEKAYQLMLAIELCGASPELTKAVTLADEIYQHLKKPITA